MSFPCSRCGVCCKNLHHVDSLASLHSGDGVCKHYVAEKGCTIYLCRPILCRIDEGYAALFSHAMDKATYYRKNAETCNSLQEQAGLDTSFRIKLI